MNKNMWKTTLREIRASFGRYLAIFAIIALGVGFFSGLKVTRQAMVEVTDDYVNDCDMFDYRLVSTLGLTSEDVDKFASLEGVEHAYGAYQADAVVSDGSSEFTVRFHSLDPDVNTPKIKAGRLPENAGEILADARYCPESVIGTDVYLADSNTEDTLDNFAQKEFNIVGLAYSPLYLNYERGTTPVGNGSVTYFYLVLPEAFDIEVYTDIYLTLKSKAFIYSAEYDALIEEYKPVMEDALRERADIRYNGIYDDARAELDDAQAELKDAEKKLTDAHKEIDDGKKEIAEKEQELKSAEAELADFSKPSVFVLTRDENIGYACFENDSKIVDGVAVVFPVFFFLVAALVCVTTMSRMIEEQRTQIGVLKALGYSEAAVMSKYMIYSGSAALFGCIGGFFLGCYAFPKIIWIVYGLMYGFTDIHFVFNPVLFAISIVVSLLCSVGTTYISCRREMHLPSAELIRPKSPKNGKRILLEHITFIWKRIKFLHKVSIRNIFRYKGRFIMMLLGIGGCTGLLITGFGIRDSISEIADEQYGQIQVYDESLTFSDEMTESDLKAFEQKYSDSLAAFMPLYQTSLDPVGTDSIRSVTLITFAHEDGWLDVIKLHDADGTQLEYPGTGEVILAQNTAKINNVKTGDTISFTDSDHNLYTLKVSGICDNYFNSFAYISADTYTGIFNTAPPYKSALTLIKSDFDLHEAAAAFLNDEKVSAVSVSADTLNMFSKMMQSMNYIVVLVTACAAALAFIVLYNLTNINITERIREIATIKVLGFYPGETAVYVFRENLALTALGAVCGIPIGIWLHGFVMSNIKIDMVSFDVHINTVSYLYSFLFTFAFAAFVDFVMFFKLARINMAESLKSIE